MVSKLKELVGVLLEVAQKVQPIYTASKFKALPAEKSSLVINIYEAGSVQLKPQLDESMLTLAALNELAKRESEINRARDPKSLIEAYEDYLNTLAQQVIEACDRHFAVFQSAFGSAEAAQEAVRQVKSCFPFEVLRKQHAFGDEPVAEVGDPLSASEMRRQMESLRGALSVKSAASPQAPRHDFRDGRGPLPAHRHHNPDGTTIGGWVAETAQVARTAHVDEGSKVFGQAKVYGHAKIKSSRIFEQASVFDHAVVQGDCEISGNAQVYEQAVISEGAKVGGGAKIFGKAKVSGGAEVSGSAVVRGDADIYGMVYLVNGEYVGSVFVPHQFGTE